MDKVIGTEAVATTRAKAEPARQAYEILHWGFVALPTIAGIDKFTHILANWDQYLAGPIEKMLPFSGHVFMMLVGVIELIAALIVAIKPRVGAYIVAAWLVGIIVNLFIDKSSYDVALRDFGRFLAALALGRLAAIYDRGRPARARVQA